MPIFAFVNPLISEERTCWIIIPRVCGFPVQHKIGRQFFNDGSVLNLSLHDCVLWRILPCQALLCYVIRMFGEQLGCVNCRSSVDKVVPLVEAVGWKGELFADIIQRHCLHFVGALHLFWDEARHVALLGKD